MDRITKNLLDGFLEQFEIKPESEPKDFEKFCNYSVVKNEFNNEFEIEDISTGNNQGIDGLGIIVNNLFINTTQEVEDIVKDAKILDVVFVFIQSKTSTKFEGSEIGNFIFSIKDFFNENPELIKTDEIKEKFAITQILFKHFSLMTKGNPLCKLYYVTAGKWVDDQNLTAVINNNVKELKDMGLFEDVFFVPCDAQKIQKLYRKTSEEVTAEFSFDEMVTLPKINGVEEAYLGIIKFEEYKKIITDENGKMQNIFYDNVRDYLGENSVNQKIDKTLKDKKFDIFAILNNGITIVADKKNSSKGKLFSVSNYQVVNGCQTSHTLFNNKELEGIDKITVPVKLIITQNEDIKNNITIATNSQTEIKEEQLVAFSDFQKNLEQYYKTFKDDNKLFYERRTGQYNTEHGVTKTKIVTIKNQIKTFASMFLNVPHLASGYYGKLYKDVKDKIFDKDHKYNPYYLSSLAIYKIEKFTRAGSIDRKYNKARYHILMLFRMANQSCQLPEFNSKDIEDYCDRLISILYDENRALMIFKAAIKVIDDSNIDINNRKLLYQKSTTDLLIDEYKKNK
ncbi:MAG: AIPR family protein [Patescibacteria group bacterium]